MIVLFTPSSYLCSTFPCIFTILRSDLKSLSSVLPASTQCDMLVMAEGKKVLQMHEHRCKDYVKTDFKEMRYEGVV